MQGKRSATDALLSNCLSPILVVKLRGKGAKNGAWRVDLTDNIRRRPTRRLSRKRSVPELPAAVGDAGAPSRSASRKQVRSSQDGASACFLAKNCNRKGERG